jgi:hypothetical protein
VFFESFMEPQCNGFFKNVARSSLVCFKLDCRKWWNVFSVCISTAKYKFILKKVCNRKDVYTANNTETKAHYFYKFNLVIVIQHLTLGRLNTKNDTNFEHSYCLPNSNKFSSLKPNFKVSRAMVTLAFLLS